MPYPRRGGGGGAGFTLGPEQNVFTGATLTAAESARDTYFTANPTNLAIYNNDTSLNIRLEYVSGSDSIAAYQVRNNAGDAWLVNQSFIAMQGQPGAQGADGLQLEFSSRQKLDEFFLANPDRLVTNLPVVMHIEDNVVTDLVWNGPDSPTDYVIGDLRWRTAASRVSNNSLFIGSTRISNAVEDILVTTGDGSQFLAVGVGFTSAGSQRINDIELSAQETLTVNALDDQVLADPFSLGYETFGDNLTVDFEFKPNEAGDLRAIYHLGTDDSGPVIFDETRTVTQAEVDSGAFISFGIGNPYMLDQNIQIFVTFSGIQLKGGTVTGGQFDGQTIIAFQSTIQPFERFPIARMNEVGGQVDSISEGFLISVDDTDPANPEVSVGFSLGSGLSIDNTDPDNPVLNSTTALPIQDEGLQVSSAPTAINFVGSGVTATESGGVVTVTITGGGGGGTPPTPIANDLRYGLSTESDPALVDFAALTDEANPTDPITISTGTTTAGQYFHIFSANTHEIQTITDTVLSQIVYQLGGTGNIFTLTSDSRTEASTTYDAYSIGPLNAGVDEEYVLAFS